MPFPRILLKLQLWTISSEILEKRVIIKQGHSPHNTAVQQSPPQKLHGFSPQKLHGFSLCYLQCPERHHVCSWTKTWSLGSQTRLRNKMKAWRNTEVLLKRFRKKCFQIWPKNVVLFPLCRRNLTFNIMKSMIGYG